MIASESEDQRDEQCRYGQNDRNEEPTQPVKSRTPPGDGSLRCWGWFGCYHGSLSDARR